MSLFSREAILILKSGFPLPINNNADRFYEPKANFTEAYMRNVFA